MDRFIAEIEIKISVQTKAFKIQYGQIYSTLGFELK